VLHQATKEIATVLQIINKKELKLRVLQSVIIPPATTPYNICHAVAKMKLLKYLLQRAQFQVDVMSVAQDSSGIEKAHTKTESNHNCDRILPCFFLLQFLNWARKMPTAGSFSPCCAALSAISFADHALSSLFCCSFFCCSVLS
jgi:hypothetical protein